MGTLNNRGLRVAQREVRKGDDAVVHTNRVELRPADYTGKTGRVIAVQQGTGDVLLEFKGKAWPVSFPRNFVGVRFND